MITRESRNLIGLVKKVETEFAIFEIENGKPIETRNQSAGYSIYDLEGRLIEEVSPYRSMMQDSYKDLYFYDEKGDLDYREEYDIDKSLFGKSVFEKLADGNTREKSYYFDDQKKLKLGSHTIYEGNYLGEDEDESLIIESASYNENEKIIPSHFYKYSPPERVRKNIVNTDEGKIIEELKIDEKGEFYCRIKTVHDLNGNRKEFFCYEPNGTLYLKDEFIYKFDSNGNWIEQITNHWVIGWGAFKLIPLTITRRKIEYFDKK